MAKVTGPMFTISASGTVGDALNFLHWMGSPFPQDYKRTTVGIVRKRTLPLIKKTPELLAIRSTLSAAVSTWHDDSKVDAMSRHSWIYFSSGLAMSPFNRYVQMFIESNPQRQPPWEMPSPQ
jgi:hypothetical protein